MIKPIETKMIFIWLPRNTSYLLMIQEAVIVPLGFNYVGAKSDINVWNPQKVQAGDYSSAQIWLLGGISDTFESIEASWMIFFILTSIIYTFCVTSKP